MVWWVPSFEQDIVILLSGLSRRIRLVIKQELFHKQSSEMHVICLTRSLGFEALAAPTHTSLKCSPWTDLPDKKKTGLSKESWEFLIGLNSTNSCVPFLRKPIYLIFFPC